jgi:hypothetical protein
MLHQRPRSDRAVRIGRRQSEKAFEHGSCCGGPLRWSGATDRSRFTACCGHEAERLAIAEPPCERILDQARRQRRCLAPTTRPDQCEGRWLGLGSQQDQQGAADLDQVKPAQQDRPASLPHRAHAVGELEGGQQRLNGLIANGKFCWARTLQLHLSWSRARIKLEGPTPRHLSAEAIPHGAEHAAEAHLARPADRRADGDRPAALGPGLPASPAVGGNASSCADRGAGAPNPAGDVSCE